MKKYLRGISLMIFFFILGGIAWNVIRPIHSIVFDGKRAMDTVVMQMQMGARVPGTEAHEEFIRWAMGIFQENGWEVELQEGVFNGSAVKNIIAKRGAGLPWVILGAHYDSRPQADQDPKVEMRTQPVPGANDGASGVSVLVELSRVIPKDLDATVWFVLFDLEDGGDLEGQEWILGSKYFVQQLTEKPDVAVIVDMVGDADLKLYYEGFSDRDTSAQIWRIAKALGYSDIFIPESKYTIIDDHYPFIEAGIPAVDIIDFEYPYWHTTEDTVDKLSEKSLEAVGRTIQSWLLELAESWQK